MLYAIAMGQIIIIVTNYCQYRRLKIRLKVRIGQEIIQLNKTLSFIVTQNNSQTTTEQSTVADYFGPVGSDRVKIVVNYGG